MISNTFLIFIKAAEHQNFNVAAKELNLTPSAISHAISKLEYELDITLFIRKKKNVILTSEGKELLVYARKIVDHEREFRQEASRIKGPISGTIKIGTVSSICINWLPNIIRDFTKKYPLANIIVKQGGYSDIKKWIENGEIDIGFVTDLHVEGFNYIFLYADELMAILPKSFNNKNKNYITIEDLKDKQIIHQPNENTIEYKFIPDSQSNYSQYYVIEDDLALVALIEAGIGFAICSELTMRHHHDKVKALPFKPKEYRNICLIWHQDKMVLPLTKKMHEHIFEYATKQSEIIKNKTN